ncbi:MAG: hypothetical protein AAF485_17795 [Chloroflexota bacterium]
MQEGLLWFDNNPQRTLIDKVTLAAKRYQTRFGQRPTICYLNTADCDTAVKEAKGIRLRTAPNILRHHLWIGVEPKRVKAS